MKRVFISTTSFAKEDSRPLSLLKEAGLNVQINPYGRILSEDEMIGFLSDKDYLIAGTEGLNRRVLESAKNLKIISRCGVGLDNVDLESAERFGIKVYNTPYGPTLAVAELTVGLIMDLLRKISVMDHEIRAGKWNKQMGNLLSGKKIGIIGFGRIGQRTVELLKGFDVKIAYFDTASKKTKFSFKPLNGLLLWADIITLHCSTEGIHKPVLGKEELKKMKKGAWLINTSRGELIDEGALYLALKEGHLAGAALDVFGKEPYTGPLAELDNVILTPHVGSYAKEARIEMEIQSAQNLLKGIKGR